MIYGMFCGRLLGISHGMQFGLLCAPTVDIAAVFLCIMPEISFMCFYLLVNWGIQS